MGKLKGD